tara:strand:- start:473 stop:703 length:231 start_codon:yes stop_codon:yes gene_type:complete
MRINTSAQDRDDAYSFAVSEIGLSELDKHSIANLVFDHDAMIKALDQLGVIVEMKPRDYTAETAANRKAWNPKETA